MTIDELYDELYDELLSWCSMMCGDRTLAEDFVQEGFFRAVKNAKTLLPLHESQQRAWLYRTIKNVYFNHIRHAAFESVAEGVGTYVVCSAAPGTVARGYSGGELVRKIDLSRVEKACSFNVTSENGRENIISFEPGRIRVSSADCPDKICVNQGWVDSGAAPIVCLPNELVIRLTDPEGTEDIIDAVS